jgi:hypothetical protein
MAKNQHVEKIIQKVFGCVKNFTDICSPKLNG